MRILFKRVIELSSDDTFVHFQNDLSEKVYNALGQGYSADENEIGLIKRLIGAINGQSYRGIRIFATILHGTRSYVEFNYLDKPVTKELGDMAVISLVTDGAERLLQKICIVQNKKAKEQSWGIDAEQLYLLKNFPSFSGNKGIFRKCKNMAFRNVSGCLGAYALLSSPGEMVLASAPLVTEMLRGRKTLSISDLSVLPNTNPSRWNSHSFALPWWQFFPWHHPKEIFLLLEELWHHYGYAMGLQNIGNRFLGNVNFSRDVYDFIRDWT